MTRTTDHAAVHATSAALKRVRRPVELACIVLIVTAGMGRGDIIQTNAASRSETAFVAATFDLINSGASSLSSAAHAGFAAFSYGGSRPTSADNLNDGRSGLPYFGSGHPALSTVSYDSDGRWTSTYRLDTSVNTRGYDISAIRTMSGWSGVARNQQFELSFATVASPETFTSYGSYSYLPGGFGAARITLTDSAGAIATNVSAVRFSVQQAGGSRTVYREFDVFGAPAGSGRPSAFTRLSPDDSRIAYSDYARMVKLDADEARFDRPVVGGQGSLQNANPGARVRFRTDASMITASFTTGTLGVTQGIGVILVDGVRAGTFDAGVSNSTLEVDVPAGGGGYRDVELLMPYSQDIRFNGLLVDGEARFQSPTTRSPIRYVAYGDSITQGLWSSDSHANYPSIVGQRNGWEVVNMGFGWRGMKDAGGDGAVVGSLGAEVISVMMGYNDASARLSSSSYRASMEAFIAGVRQADSTVPIYLISPLYTSNAANQARMVQYRDQIMDLVSGSSDRNLHWIDGLALGIDAGNVAAYTSDGIHPNDAGFVLVASNLANRMSPSSFLPTAGLGTGGRFLQAAPLVGADFAKLQIVPEPAAITLATVAASIMLLRRRCCRRASTIVASKVAAA